MTIIKLYVNIQE